MPSTQVRKAPWVPRPPSWGAWPFSVQVGLQARADLLDPKDRPAQPGTQEPPDHRVRQEPPGHRVRQEPPGPTGATGPQGPQGPAGQPDYAYVYNTTAETVAVESDVTFSTNGPLSGFTHTAASASIDVVSTGTYLIRFSVTGTQASQFTLMDNGVAVAGTTYGSSNAPEQNQGQAIVNLTAADVLTLRNHTSSTAVTLETLAGGTQTNVNASILIQQLA